MISREIIALKPCRTVGPYTAYLSSSGPTTAWLFCLRTADQVKIVEHVSCITPRDAQAPVEFVPTPYVGILHHKLHLASDIWVGEYESQQELDAALARFYSAYAVYGYSCGTSYLHRGVLSDGATDLPVVFMSRGGKAPTVLTRHNAGVLWTQC
jgi:hypothetical protein